MKDETGDQEQIPSDWSSDECSGTSSSDEVPNDTDGASVKGETDDQEHIPKDWSSDEFSGTSSSDEVPNDKAVISDLDSSRSI